MTFAMDMSRSSPSDMNQLNRKVTLWPFPVHDVDGNTIIDDAAVVTGGISFLPAQSSISLVVSRHRKPFADKVCWSILVCIDFFGEPSVNICPIRQVTSRQSRRTLSQSGNTHSNLPALDQLFDFDGRRCLWDENCKLK